MSKKPFIRPSVRSEIIELGHWRHDEKYDYSLLGNCIYFSETVLPVICKDHGCFMVKTVDHLIGDRVSGCPECKIND